ncbi:3861_t:CDS:2, partial [Scutellospora calospora]
SQDDEALAFKSQFDEISNISRMLENAKTNNNSYNNRYHGSPGRVHSGFSSSNYLSSQRRINVRSHHRSFSHPSLPTTRQNLQNKRNFGSFYLGHHRLASLPSPYNGVPYSAFDLFGHDEDLPLNFDDPLTTINDSSGLKTLETCGRFGFKSGSSIDPFTSLPISPNNFMQHSLLDDDELVEKQLMLEEERMILQMKRQELDNAIYKLHYQNFDSSLNHSLSSLIETRYKLSQTPPQTTRGSASTTPSLSRQTSFSKNLSPQPLRFQPIGTPVRKPATNDYSASSTMSNSAPSQSTFSLFSKSPGLSLNHSLPTVDEQRLSSNMDDILDDKLNDFPLIGYPLTPSGTPPKNDDRCQFLPSSVHPSANHLNPVIWSSNNDDNFASHSKSLRSLPKRDYFSAPTTPNCYTPTTPQFNRNYQQALNQLSIGHFNRASPLYSSPLDERDELWHGDETFNPILSLTPPEISSTNKISHSINDNTDNLLSKNNSCHQFHNVIQPKLLSSTHKTGNGFFSLVGAGNQVASDSHYDGFTYNKGMRVNGLYKLEVM